MTNTCFCISLRNAARKTSSIYDEALEPVGINVAQFSLLRKIEHSGSLSLTELARIAKLDRSTVGRNTKVLHRLGLIENCACADQREATIDLTAAGRSTLTAAAPLWDKAQAQIEAALGEDGVNKLEALLEQITES